MTLTVKAKVTKGQIRFGWSLGFIQYLVGNNWVKIGQMGFSLVADLYMNVYITGSHRTAMPLLESVGNVSECTLLSSLPSVLRKTLSKWRP